jgi:hypothetical protein
MANDNNRKEAICLLVKEFPILFEEHTNLLKIYNGLQSKLANFIPWQQYLMNAQAQVAIHTSNLSKGNCENKIDEHIEKTLSIKNYEDVFGDLVYHFNNIAKDYTILINLIRSNQELSLISITDFSEKWNDILCTVWLSYGLKPVGVANP